jgi:hypothetical protein
MPQLWLTLAKLPDPGACDLNAPATLSDDTGSTRRIRFDRRSTIKAGLCDEAG